MDEIRDPEIGGLLADGSVAEHEPGYWDALRAAVAPELAALEPQALRRERPRRRRLLRMGLAAAAVAAAAAVFAFAVLPALRGTDTATAADMLASMNAAATGEPHVVRLSVKESDWKRPVPEQLILSTSGDVRWVIKGRRETTYWTQDARRHTTMSLGVVTPDDGTSVLAIERPSWGESVYQNWMCANMQALAASLRAQLAEGDPDSPVSETTYLGRPAWRAVLREHWAGDAEHPEGATMAWNAVVDKQTGLLVASGFGGADGQNQAVPEGYSFWVTRIQVDPKLPKDWQRLSQRGQERILIRDEGTRFGTPQSVAKLAWPTPVLVPQQVPAGYRLTDVAITNFEGMKSPQDEAELVYHSRRPGPYKAEWVRTSIDSSVRRVVARYRRGFSSFVVDIRPPARGDAEIGEVGTILQSGVDAKLTAGYLKGQLAGTSISPNGSQGPTLLAHSGRYTIAIYGDLTRQELLDVANSLTATGGAGE